MTPERGCVDCGWTGKADELVDYGEYGKACPSCGCDTMPYDEYLTEKAEDR